MSCAVMYLIYLIYYPLLYFYHHNVIVFISLNRLFFITQTKSIRAHCSNVRLDELYFFKLIIDSSFYLQSSLSFRLLFFLYSAAIKYFFEWA